MYQQQQQQQYYDYEPNSQYQQNAYAMNNMTRPYQQESKPTLATSDGYYNHDSVPVTPPTRRISQVGAINEKYARRNNKANRSCCDTLCCGCCTCCPKWCRWISCILLLIIIIIGIIVGVLAALFKVPTVEFTGIQGTPAFGLVGLTTVNLNVSLGFVVSNPNIESVTFTTLVATANYHGDTTPLGGGTYRNLHIGSHSVTNISFPFEMTVDITNNNNIAVLSKIMADCGLDGSNHPKDIQLDYKVVATVTIIGIPISIPVSNSVSFQCPIDSNEQSSLISTISSVISGLTGGGGLGDLIGTAASSAGRELPTDLIPTDAIPTDLIPTDLIPSDILASLPAGIPTDIASLGY